MDVVDGKRKRWVGNVASTELNVAFSDVCRKKSKKGYETKYTFIMLVMRGYVYFGGDYVSVYFFEILFMWQLELKLLPVILKIWERDDYV